MDNKIHDTFNKIRAEKALKQKTANFLYEKIQQNGSRRASPFRFAAVYVSIILLFIMGALSHNLYSMPRAYVDIDVNPSIELVVNRFGRVIEISSFNDDGAVILEDIDVRHMGYKDAVDKLIGAMAKKNYLKQDGLVSVTVQTNNENRRNNMLAGLKITVENILQKHNTNTDSNIFAVSEGIWSHAHKNHMTPAKYLAISKLQQVDPTATFEGCQMHTISEINQMIQTPGSGHHSGDTDSKDGKNHGGEHH